MASAAKTASRAFLRSTPATSSFRPAARSARFTVSSQAFRSSRRGYSTEAPQQGKSSNGLLWAGLAAAGGAGAYFYLKGGDVSAKNFVPQQKDYQAVYDEIARKLADETDYDDGSYGPVSRLFDMN
jgi:cytochrome c peroxidase